MARKHGDPVLAKYRCATPEESFAKHVDTLPANECWPWKGALSLGYGKISTPGGVRPQMQAHRWSYQKFNGPIPDGAVVMHACDNKACVNPAHLSIGTQADNIADMDGKGRRRSSAPKGEKQHLAKLDEAAVRHIRASKRGCTELGALYGVHRDTILFVRQRKTWKHVT